MDTAGARVHRTLEHEDLDVIARPPSSARLRAALERRYSPRLHMALILTASALSAMVVSWAMLAVGVESMMWRYLPALTISYLVFLFGVWVWLRLMGYIGPGERPDLSFDGGGGGGHSSASGGGSVDVPRGGGGTFDGGGASASWSEASPTAVRFAATPSGGDNGSNGAFSDAASGFDIDGEGLVLVVLAIVVVAAIFMLGGYLVYVGPEVLAEAAFGAVLTGALAKRTARNSRSGWVGGVVKKTCVPYAVVMALAVGFAWYAQHQYPAATTFKQAVTMALHDKH